MKSKLLQQRVSIEFYNQIKNEAVIRNITMAAYIKMVLTKEINLWKKLSH